MNPVEPAKENKLLYFAALFAGFMVILASLSRAISLNNFYVASHTGDINKSYAPSVIINWALSSFLLFLVGIWLLFLAGDLKKRIRRSWTQALIIALVITIFGAAFWIQYPASMHLAGFLLLGLSLLIALVFFGRPQKSA
jgi:lysylphosphatidylglycerol synthetase-like protein (DUF2156 family)